MRLSVKLIGAVAAFVAIQVTPGFAAATASDSSEGLSPSGAIFDALRQYASDYESLKQSFKASDVDFEDLTTNLNFADSESESDSGSDEDAILSPQGNAQRETARQLLYDWCRKLLKSIETQMTSANWSYKQRLDSLVATLVAVVVGLAACKLRHVEKFKNAGGRTWRCMRFYRYKYASWTAIGDGKGKVMPHEKLGKTRLISRGKWPSLISFVPQVLFQNPEGEKEFFSYGERVSEQAIQPCPLHNNFVITNEIAWYSSFFGSYRIEPKDEFEKLSKALTDKVLDEAVSWFVDSQSQRQSDLEAARVHVEITKTYPVFTTDSGCCASGCCASGCCAGEMGPGDGCGEGPCKLFLCCLPPT